MRVLQDHQMFVRSKFGGVARYHYDLCNGLTKLGENSRILVLFPQCEYLKRDKKIFNYSNKIVRSVILVLNDICTIFYILINNMLKKPIDILHITWYKIGYVRVLKWLLGKKRPRLIITIHDLIHEMIQNENPVMKRGVIDRQKALKLADGIICVSENTKNDLLAYYPEVSNIPIEVIYHCIRCENLDITDLKINKKFILFVGNRSGYKNFINFLNGIGPILLSDHEYFLYCAGGGSFSDEEKALINDLNIEDRAVQKNVSDGELTYLYRHASCFVFPSLYEGFGIPILEAFYNKCPLLLHDGSCFPEIAGDAAIYFDGNDAKSICSAVRSVIYDDNLKNKLIEKGEERLKSFSSEKTVGETASFYKKILNFKE